jgi:hypothetical protein
MERFINIQTPSYFMANKSLLDNLGIKTNPQYASRVNEMSNQEAVQEAINSTSRGRIRDYFAMGLGTVLFADGVIDCGAKILERITSVATNRDFNLYTVLEIAVGAGIAYLGIRANNKKEAGLKSLATSLNDHYVKD